VNVEERARPPFPIRRPAVVLAIAGLLTLGGAGLASKLSVKTDLSHLLPPGSVSVRDLDDVQRRAQAFGNLLVGIEADSPTARAAAARQLARRLGALAPGLVAGIIADDGSLRRHLWQRRYLYAPIEELEEIRDELAGTIARANPLFVDLSPDDRKSDRLATMRARLDDAEARARSPAPLVSKDGRMQMIVVRATFPSTDVAKSRRVHELVQAAIAATLATAPPGVRIGATGDIATVIVEQDAIVRGMALATLITTLLVALALLLYYRSLPALAVIFGALTVGTITTLAFARLAVGHLNSATAFLISIVIGNGINFPMLVVARYLEERRLNVNNVGAAALAVRATRRGTIAAASTAFVAYGSLVVTDFRGFRDFGIIGAVGMLLCWTAAYTVAPAALVLLGRRGLFDRPAREPALGRALAWLLPRRPGRAVVALALLAPLLVVLAGRYLTSDPFEYNLRHLRASGAEARQARAWQAKLDDAFGRGISGGFVVAVERREDAPAVAARLRAVTGSTTTRQSGPLLARVSSLDDVLPAHQERRLALLREIQRLIDRNADRMPEATAAEARRLRPPGGLRALRDQDIPVDLALQFSEKDGRRGRLIFANTAPAVNGWDGRDLKTVSQRVRALDLPPGTRVAGSAFVFADMIEAIRRDGPRATLVAFAAVLIVIAVTMGVGRHGLLTAASAVLGTTAMLALCSMAGVKINFLDFVALPLTLGIGTDYAANVLSRARQEAFGATRRAVVTTGGVVVLCSFTTIVGYASLLATDNAGIRSFGLAAMLGELTCVVAGVWAGPVLLHAFERRFRRERR
jgi:predicted RND superfamily exporter protein